MEKIEKTKEIKKDEHEIIFEIFKYAICILESYYTTYIITTHVKIS